MLRDRLRLRDVRYNLETLARLRYALSSQHFDRRRRPGFGDRLTAIVEHRANLAGDLADDKRLVNLERSLLDEDCCHSATSAIEFCFQNNSGSKTRRTGAQ